jgi:tRNA (Thr-GGU) A37 N-methylase
MQKNMIYLSACDLVDGTPVLDIKVRYCWIIIPVMDQKNLMNIFRVAVCSML